MNSRHAVQSALRGKLTSQWGERSLRQVIHNASNDDIVNYWGERAFYQLLYLEEMNRTAGGRYEPLLDRGTFFLRDVIERDGAVTRHTAMQFEELLQPASAAAKSVTVSCVGHAHIDMNWQWGYDETAAITIDTFRTMLKLMDEYPGFTFAQSQASVYKIIEEFAPEMLPDIRRRIQEGRWEVTAATWTETDKNMPSGESLARHLLYTRQYLKGLLGLTDGQFQIDFEPDTFGHNAQVPETLAQGGVKYYYHCRGYEGHNLYRWQSPSGAHVTVFRDPTWYLAAITPESFLYIPEFCAKHHLDRMLYVYGVGDHGGGATRRDLERLTDMDTWPVMPRISFGRFIDFFRYLEGLDLPVVEGELNFVFDGCYTTQTRIKKANRAAEASLGGAEALNALSGLLGSYPYSAKAFSDAWEPVLFSHFHDILPGSCVIAAREYALGMFQRTMAHAGTRTAAAARGIGSRINTAALLPEPDNTPPDSIAEGAGVGFGVPGFNYTGSAVAGGTKRLFNLYNATQAETHGLVALTVWDWHETPDRAVVSDEAGCALPVQWLDKEPQPYWGHSYFRLLVPCSVPAFGYRTLLLAPSEKPLSIPRTIEPRVDRPIPFLLENDQVRAEFDPMDFSLVSYVDKAAGTEHIRKDSDGARFRFIMEDDHSGMTSWRVGRYRRVEALAGTKLTRGIEGTLRQSFAYTVPFQNSNLDVTVSLDPGSATLRYDAHCRWRECGEPGKGIPQLGFAVPLAIPVHQYLFDSAFGIIARAPRDADMPGGTFAFASMEQGGLMLTTDSKYGYRCTGDTMAATLIRGAYDPDPAPELYDHSFSLGLCACRTAGPLALAQTSLRFNRPVVVTDAESHGGELPPTGRLIEPESASTAIASIKLAEDGSGCMIIRLYEMAGKEDTVSLRFWKPPCRAFETDIHERTIARIDVHDGGSIRFAMRPYGVATLKIQWEESV
jgi:alpha-mannosidase